MSGFDPLLVAMTASGLINADNKDKVEKMSGDESDDKISLSSDPGNESNESEVSHGKRVVLLKRPNETAIGGPPQKERRGRGRKNPADDYKDPQMYSIKSGVLKNIFEGNFKANEPFMIQMIMKDKKHQMCLSDGKFMTDKCALTHVLGNKFLVQKLNNPVVKILQWKLKDVSVSSESVGTILIIENLVIVKNLPDFPILGLPQPLHRMKTVVTSVRTSTRRAQEMPNNFLTWKSILCFLNEVNVDKSDKRSFEEVFCKEIIAKTEYIHEFTPQGWRYLCTDCNLYKSRRLSQIVNHIQLSHLPQFPGYKCPHCSLNFQAILSFENHVKDDHSFKSNSRTHPTRHIEISSSLPKPFIANDKIQSIADLAAGILSRIDNHLMAAQGDERQHVEASLTKSKSNFVPGSRQLLIMESSTF